MSTRLRQIALAANDLGRTTEVLCDTLGIAVAHRDPGVGVFGLENAVMSLGDGFLEVVTPLRPGTTVSRLLEKYEAPCGYMVIFQTDDMARARKRIAGEGLNVVWEVDLGEAASVHLHPKEIGGAVVSLDSMQTWDTWLWAGDGWNETRGTGNCLGLAGATLEVREPALVRERWRRILGDSASALGATSLAVGDAVLEFRESAEGRERLAAFSVWVRDLRGTLERAAANGLAVGNSRFRIGSVEILLKSGG